MKKIYSILFAVLAVNFHVWCTTPTERLLEVHSIEEIGNYLGEEERLADHWPFFQEIIAKEGEKGFFGYHASTQKYRVFQDILRVTLDEVVQINLPENFYFFRIPGDSLFQLKEGKKSLFDLYARENTDIETREILIEHFLLAPARAEGGIDLSLDDFSFEEKVKLMGVCTAMAELITADTAQGLSLTAADGVLAMNPPHPKKSKLKRLIFEKLEGSPEESKKKALMQALLDFRFAKHSAETLGGFEQTFLYSFIDDMADLYSDALAKKGVFIDKIDCSQWLHKNLKMDYLLDLYFDTYAYDYYERVSRFVYPLWDTRPDQQSRVVAMNIALFGNYVRWDESSLEVFWRNQTIELGDDKTAELLKKFFIKLGINPDEVDALYAIAEEELNGSGIQEGCIFQFFDQSEMSYAKLDKHAYVSFPFGVPMQAIYPSQIISENFPMGYGNNGMQYQLRLVTSNQGLLNPRSTIRVIRWDLQGEEIAERILKRMRKHISEVPYSYKRSTIMRKALNGMWNYGTGS